MTDEQKQKRRDYQREYVKNMTDEKIQKLKVYRREYYKKYYAAKKLNNKTIYYEIIDYAAKKLNNKTIYYEIIDDDSDDDEIIDYEIIVDDSDEDNGYDSDNEMIFNILFFSKCI